MKIKVFCLSLSMLILLVSGNAQFTRNQKEEIVSEITNQLNKYYVFPETAKQLEIYLKQQLTAKLYDTVNSGKIFAELLTLDLQKIAHDKHLHVNYVDTILPKEDNTPSEMPESQKKEYARWLLRENYGIRKLEVLPGNIGYIDFKWFCGPEYGGNTYAAAMNYLNHTDALIIDLRNSNGAMSMYAIPFLSSYFFEVPTHLNDFYWREKNETMQTWTQQVVPGNKYLNKPIYMLISGKTFSGAEEFAYDLKNLKRAILIGETTGGGANGGGTIRVSDHFEIFIPSGRAINPITKTNWENVGVTPDSAIRSNKALYYVQNLILKKMIAESNETGRKMELAQILTELQQHAPTYKKMNFSLEGFETAKEVYVAGSFNNWSPTADKLKRNGNAWTITTEGEPGEIFYKFIVDGKWILDPKNKQTKSDGPNINSFIMLQ
jgi:hypothetical protein